MAQWIEQSFFDNGWSRCHLSLQWTPESMCGERAGSSTCSAYSLKINRINRMQSLIAVHISHASCHVSSNHEAWSFLLHVSLSYTSSKKPLVTHLKETSV